MPDVRVTLPGSAAGMATDMATGMVTGSTALGSARPLAGGSLSSRATCDVAEPVWAVSGSLAKGETGPASGKGCVAKAILGSEPGSPEAGGVGRLSGPGSRWADKTGLARGSGKLRA